MTGQRYGCSPEKLLEKHHEKLIEDAVLALLVTFSFDHGHAWKGFDFEAMNRLHEQGFISNPVNRNKSIWLSEEGIERGRQIADRLFGVRGKSEPLPGSDS
ncbi:transposase [Pseudomonas marginalis ICMP 9505]|nr:transposase [Pseudomonas marginalis ICMP 9505]